MKIIIDAFGGDNAPLEVIKGSIKARSDFNADICLVGDEEKIRKCAKDNSLDISALEIRHAPSVIDICEEPTEIIKSRFNGGSCCRSNIYSQENKGNKKGGACNSIADKDKASYAFRRWRQFRLPSRDACSVCGYG